MVNLVKKAGISLEKKGLSEHRARVALCLDISGSMNRLYQSGKVQELCERVLGMAVQFDDDGACDVFTFGTGGYDEGPLDLQNYQGWIDQLLQRRRLEGGTNYNHAMQAVRRTTSRTAAAGSATARARTSCRCTSCSSPTGRRPIRPAPSTRSSGRRTSRSSGSSWRSGSPAATSTPARPPR